MTLVKVRDPQKQGVNLDAVADLEEYETGGWVFKSYFGSDGEWYEKGTHKDGRVRWFILEDTPLEDD